MGEQGWGESGGVWGGREQGTTDGRGWVGRSEKERERCGEHESAVDERGWEGGGAGGHGALVPRGYPVRDVTLPSRGGCAVWRCGGGVVGVSAHIMGVGWDGWASARSSRRDSE